jgi:hypothetical protein
MTDDIHDSAARLCSASPVEERLERARNFPHNTCAVSRHAQMIGEEMLNNEETRNAGESIPVVVAALYEERSKNQSNRESVQSPAVP